MPGRALPSDYDTDPDRFAANQRSARWLSREDVHHDVARRLADSGSRLVVDIGGGNGTLARLLAPLGARAVVVDPAGYVADAPRPAVRADARALPLADGSVDAAAALWMLYHLDDPQAALREARRVLRPGRPLAVAVPSRYNDPELASVLPYWGQPLTFDAETGPDQLRQVFVDVEVLHWDRPLLHLPDRAALVEYLRGRGLTEDACSARIETPLTVTKRGMVAWARAG